MAISKNSFVLYTDLIHSVEKLSNEEAGELFKMILRYTNDLNPTTENRIVDLSFEPIKLSLKRDLSKWTKQKEDRSINGRMGNLKRYNKDLYTQVVDNEIDLDKAEDIAKHRKASHSDNSDSEPSQSIANVAVNDSVSVSVNGSVSVNDILLKKETKDIHPKKDEKFNFKNELINYGFNKELVNDWLVIRKSKGGVNTRVALNGFIKQIELHGGDKNELLEEIVSKSWAGFNINWGVETKSKNNTQYKPTQSNAGKSFYELAMEDYEKFKDNR